MRTEQQNAADPADGLLQSFVNRAGRLILSVRRRKCGLEFVMAIAAKNVLAIQKSAQAISNACNQCHAVDRE